MARACSQRDGDHADGCCCCHTRANLGRSLRAPTDQRLGRVHVALSPHVLPPVAGILQPVSEAIAHPADPCTSRLQRVKGHALALAEGSTDGLLAVLPLGGLLRLPVLAQQAAVLRDVIARGIAATQLVGLREIDRVLVLDQGVEVPAGRQDAIGLVGGALDVLLLCVLRQDVAGLARATLAGSMPPSRWAACAPKRPAVRRFVAPAAELLAPLAKRERSDWVEPAAAEAPASDSVPGFMAALA